MHYCVLVFTKELPTDEKMITVMAPFEEGEYEERTDCPVFEWDWWQIGGRYGGLLKLKADDSFNYYANESREGRQFISAFLKTYLNRFPVFKQAYEGDEALRYMGMNEGFIYCDGAKVSGIMNIDEIKGYVAIDTDGKAIARSSWTREKEEWIENANYEEEVAEMKERNRDNFITIVDIHD